MDAILKIIFFLAFLTWIALIINTIRLNKCLEEQNEILRKLGGNNQLEKDGY